MQKGGVTMFTVYLLDDEEWLLESLYEAIDWKKHDTSVVGKATSSIKALEEIQALDPDIVITDVQMPEMTGLELLTELGRRGCKSTFIILSGYAEFHYVQEALNNNAVGYCLKPFEEEKIINTLMKAQKVCAEKKLMKSLKSDVKEETFQNQTFRSICHYVKTNFTEDITLQQIADKYYLNPSYLSNLFKKELNINYSTFLAQLRIKYACKLLAETNMTVTQIANETGFTNYFYFARIFKKHKSMTPTQYRESV